MEQASCLLRENGAIYSTFRYARYIVLVGTLREPIGVNLRSNPVIDCCLTTKSRSPLTPRAVSFSDKSSFCRGSAKNAYPPRLQFCRCFRDWGGHSWHRPYREWNSPALTPLLKLCLMRIFLNNPESFVNQGFWEQSRHKPWQFNNLVYWK